LYADGRCGADFAQIATDPKETTMSNNIFDYPELLEGDDDLIPLTEACKKFRPPISRPTIERYIRVGVRDVVLRTVLMGGNRCTTASEIKRFSRAQLPNPVPPMNEPSGNIPKRSARKTGNGMTAEEVAAGLARHGLE
jgi:hypothetical protein